MPALWEGALVAAAPDCPGRPIQAEDDALFVRGVLSRDLFTPGVTDSGRLWPSGEQRGPGTRGGIDPTTWRAGRFPCDGAVMLRRQGRGRAPFANARLPANGPSPHTPFRRPIPGFVAWPLPDVGAWLQPDARRMSGIAL